MIASLRMIYEEMKQQTRQNVIDLECREETTIYPSETKRSDVTKRKSLLAEDQGGLLHVYGRKCLLKAILKS